MARSARRILALLCLSVWAAPAGADDEIRLLGELRLPSQLSFEGAPVGGLSALEYDPQRKVYYALSDDRSRFGPARFYTLRIQLGEQGIGGVEVLSATALKDADGERFAARAVDPEAMRLRGEELIWASEGDADGKPAVQVMDLATGTQRRALALPAYYLPGPASGARANGALESLTLMGGQVIVACEEALQQDGPAATVNNGSPCRVLRLDLASGAAKAEHVYVTEKVAARAIPASKRGNNGLVELLAMGDGKHLLAVERSYSPGQGNVIRLFKTSFRGASDVLGQATLKRFAPMPKTLLYTLAVGQTFSRVDNIEGATFGPEIAGRRTLLLVSDNNFSRRQVTQLIALSLPGE